MTRVYVSVAPEFVRPYDEGVGPLYDEIVGSLRQAGCQLVNVWGWKDAVSTTRIDFAQRQESIRQADLVLLLVGCLYTRDEKLGSQLVEAEYRTARESEKPCVAVLESEWAASGFGQSLLMGVAMLVGKADLAEPFREELRRTIPTVVADPSDRAAVLHAIHEALALAEAGRAGPIRAAGEAGAATASLEEGRLSSSQLPTAREGSRPGRASRPAQAGGQARVRDHVFISYSHKDGRWLEELRTHLKPYVRGGITVWDDTKIAPGSKWRDEIESALDSAGVAVLLVSPDFLASDFIHAKELPRILHAVKEEGLAILWIPLRESAYDATWIAEFQPAHPPDKPLADLRRAARDKALVKIASKIRLAARQDAAAS